MADPNTVGDSAVNDSAQLVSDAAETSVTEKVPATPEGMAVAYGSLVVMALIPIFFGSFRSVRYHREQKVSVAVTYVDDLLRDMFSKIGELQLEKLYIQHTIAYAQLSMWGAIVEVHVTVPQNSNE